jgi:rhamnosyl/mannosyltransferase
VKILVATPYLHPEGGGLERYAHEVSRGLGALGHEVAEVGPGRGTVRLSNAPVDPRFARVARRMLRKDAFDVVVGHAPVPGAAEMAAWAAAREGVPFALTYHAGALASGRRALALPAALHRATFERLMISRAAGRIAVSPFVAERAFRGLPCSVVPPGVDIARFAPGGAPAPGRVLYVGPVSRAYAWKGLAVLAEAVRRVPGATLRAVGDGDLASRYRALGVDVVGRVSDERLVEEYRAASVVALPSLTPAESFGMVLAEANACGRPVVGSRVGGIPCFVRDGENGLLARPGDAADLARAIGRILDGPDEARRMGERGRGIVEREHGWDRIAALTQEVLENIVQGRTRTPHFTRATTKDAKESRWFTRT